MENNKIQIYTDGAARGNPGLAGWAAVFLSNGKVFFELGGRENYATNNQMELTAVIEALRHVRNNNISMPIEIFCDSKYVISGATEWIFNWQKNNWRNAAKKPVLNRELWESLHELTQELKPKWVYVEGHAGVKYNERADEIATSFADANPIELAKK